ncbi:hypothetical protein E1091_19085 [Micromonospora fluostatini]|uniref:Integrase n=1 Tax=Micromonospora fluostatini TaxID=1629071 RepID=A0ABY2DC10_9ACTN|nr:hypothetical protein E1091_19085 [Micromonospora fluostatini]
MSPTVDTLRAAVDRSVGGAADRSWLRLRESTGPAVDLADAAHRRAALVWLNAWGCRLRYPRPGEEDVFGTGLARWWARHHPLLPAARTPLAALPETALPALVSAFADLAAMPVTPGPRRRTLGPTAASKLLYAVRPAALPPWDDAIARALHGCRDADAYGAHLRLTRSWALRLLAEAGTDEVAFTTALGHPGRTLAKMLDDYCYQVHTRGFRHQPA